MPILLLERPACSISPLDDRVIIRKLLTQRRGERIPMSAHPSLCLVPALTNFRQLNSLNGKASCFLHLSQYLQSFQAFVHSFLSRTAFVREHKHTIRQPASFQSLRNSFLSRAVFVREHKPHIEFHALLPCFHRLAHSCKNNGGCTPSSSQNYLAGAKPRSTQSSDVARVDHSLFSTFRFPVHRFCPHPVAVLNSFRDNPCH